MTWWQEHDTSWSRRQGGRKVNRWRAPTLAADLPLPASSFVTCDISWYCYCGTASVTWTMLPLTATALETSRLVQCRHTCVSASKPQPAPPIFLKNAISLGKIHCFWQIKSNNEPWTERAEKNGHIRLCRDTVCSGCCTTAVCSQASHWSVTGPRDVATIWVNYLLPSPQSHTFIAL